MADVIHHPETDACAREPLGDVVCDYRLLADGVIEHLNPSDGDEAEVYLCRQAVERAVAFIESLPCTCKPGSDDDPCGRCATLGQWHGEPVQR